MLEGILEPSSPLFWGLIIALISFVIVIISRPLATYIKFVYPNAKFEAIGNPFIEEKELGRLLDSKNISGFKDMLNTIKDYNLKGETTDEIQRSLDNNLLQIIQMMKEDSSKKMEEFYNVYLEKLDIYLVKNEIKRKIQINKNTRKTNADDAILPKTRELIIKLEYAEKKDLPDILKTYGFEKEIIDAVSEEKTDFLKLDTALDKHFIKRFKQVKVPHKCGKAKQIFANSMIDIINIKNVLRGKQLGYDKTSCKKLFIGEGKEIAPWKYDEMIEAEQVSQIISSLEGTSYYNVLKDAIEQYNKERSVQVLENALDSVFLKIIREIAMQNYITIGPTFRFLVSKEIEIKNLKIIAKGIGENLPSDTFKNYLIKEAI